MSASAKDAFSVFICHTSVTSVTSSFFVIISHVAMMLSFSSLPSNCTPAAHTMAVLGLRRFLSQTRVTIFPDLSRPKDISVVHALDPAQKIWGVGRDMWDAFSSLSNECCSNDMLYFDSLIGHEVRGGCDSHDTRWDTVLKHLLSEMCASVFSPLCQLLAHCS